MSESLLTLPFLQKMQGYINYKLVKGRNVAFFIVACVHAANFHIFLVRNKCVCVFLLLSENAPVCKFLMGSTIGSSILLLFPLKQYQPYFIYTHTSVFGKAQVGSTQFNSVKSFCYNIRLVLKSLKW